MNQDLLDRICNLALANFNETWHVKHIKINNTYNKNTHTYIELTYHDQIVPKTEYLVTYSHLPNISLMRLSSPYKQTKNYSDLEITW